MALAKNLGSPLARAHQNHLLRTNPGRRITRFRFCFPAPVSRSRFAASFRKLIGAQCAALHAAPRPLPHLACPGRLFEAKSLIISTCITRFLQVSQNQHLRIPGWNSIRMNTCRKRGGGGWWVAAPVSSPSFLRSPRG